MKYASMTDKGLVRKNNEDSLIIVKEGDDLVFAVADGMGGHAMGEVASRTALQFVRSAVPDLLASVDNQRELESQLHSTVEKANVMVYLESLKKKEYHGMGTTLTLGALHDWRLILSHIGDTRAYLLHGAHLTRLTVDHTLVQQMLEEKMITEKEAAEHPKRHMLVRSLGVNEYMSPDTCSFDIAEGDLILLCSDGLHGYVKEKEIRDILRKHRDLGLCVQQLVDAANHAGGHDNISVILVHCNRD